MTAESSFLKNASPKKKKKEFLEEERATISVANHERRQQLPVSNANVQFVHHVQEVQFESKVRWEVTVLNGTGLKNKEKRKHKSRAHV